ncbi:hypothetical protein [Deinococcus sp. QL22]|uniref:hypothetical protein n=1 Tax=Deinococcus sp. QL22 TaxID=2939437 RepID=UPI00201816FA|nr:hypothetical protein [Deinococcus sp. QL22]UQN05440.1 hypothetical protein M1R55_11200 [Deinococcus sp. QL22]
MSLEIKLRDLLTRLGTEFKSVRATTGNLADLTTAQKTSLVAAINELNALLASSSSINDAAPGTTTSYSSSKTDQQIQAAITALVDGADPALNTLKELAQALAADQSGIAALVTALEKRVRFDAAQVLTAPEQAQARTNMGAASAAAIGDTERNLVADFEAAL